MKKEVDININITIDAQPGTSTPQKSLPFPTQETKQEKLRVNLSVPQIAYIFRVMTDLGVIETDNISEVIRFISKNLSTPNAEDISVDSLRGRFYKPTQAAKESFHDLIVKQLNHIRKDLKSSK